MANCSGSRRDRQERRRIDARGAGRKQLASVDELQRRTRQVRRARRPACRSARRRLVVLMRYRFSAGRGKCSRAMLSHGVCATPPHSGWVHEQAPSIFVSSSANEPVERAKCLGARVRRGHLELNLRSSSYPRHILRNLKKCSTGPFLQIVCVARQSIVGMKRPKMAWFAPAMDESAELGKVEIWCRNYGRILQRGQVWNKVEDASPLAEEGRSTALPETTAPRAPRRAGPSTACCAVGIGPSERHRRRHARRPIAARPRSFVAASPAFRGTAADEGRIRTRPSIWSRCQGVNRHCGFARHHLIKSLKCRSPAEYAGSRAWSSEAVLNPQLGVTAKREAQS